MILDNGFHLGAMIRYPSRVIDFVEFTPDGSLRTITERLMVNQAAYEISKVLDEKYSGLPNVLLENAFANFSQKMHPELWFRRSNGKKYGHGTSIFAKLAEYNPFAEFVLIDDESFSATQDSYGLDLCKIDEGDREINKYKNFSISIADNIVALIKKHDINFISFSFSTNIQFIENQLRKRCKKEFQRELLAKLLQADLDYFFKPLYSIPGVIAVQAILPPGNFYSHDAQQDNRIDCTAFGNRLRVGAYGVLDSRVPIDGMLDAKYLDKIRGSLPCTDLTVNLGEPWHGKLSNPVFPECFVHFSYDPFLPPEPPGEMAISSSFGVPIALSYLIYLKNTLPMNTSANEIISVATSEGKKLVKDPVRIDR